ncbi:peptidoglycan DD-metalloendopeptidase family protein [Alteromonas sp. SM 2104]|nr:peptidoglycan DD-metalloendopeptidase family protein [Alteromonas oceanisediminis]
MCALLVRFVVVLSVLSGSAKATTFVDEFSGCFDDWWCAEQSSHHQHAVLVLQNRTRFPVVVTTEFWWRNAISVDNQPLPKHMTVSLGPEERVELVVIKPRQLNQTTRVYSRFHWVGGVLNATHDDTYRYQLPFAPEQQYRMVQGFGGGYSHTGASRYAVDFAMPVGTPVHAARGGLVIDTEQSHRQGGASRRYAKYANYVVILHSDGTTGEYYHLQFNGVAVETGEEVSAGDMLGYSGNTGFSSLPHLHFAVYSARAFGEYQSIPFQFLPH